MCFLDGILAAITAMFLLKIRSNKTRGVFDRDTTAALRGVAMLGIILHHIHNELHYFSPIMNQMGYLGTALFFFISGYGNMRSINKSDSVQISWIRKKFVKIYLPYFIVYWVYAFVYVRFNFGVLTFDEVVIDLVTVSLPKLVSWFPKIILLCFFIQWISKKITNKSSVQLGIITTAIVSYMFIVKYMGWWSYWYNSVLCYAIGCIFSEFYEKHHINKAKQIFAGLGVLFLPLILLAFKIYSLQTVVAIVFSICCFYFTAVFMTNSTLLAWIGNNSFEMYLLHLTALKIFTSWINNRILYTGLVLFSSMLLLWLYQNITSIVGKTFFKLRQN